MRLDATAVAAGLQLLALEQCGSTNEEALQRARRGERRPLWITADTQTAGRGRMGRFWTSPPGNLHASLLVFDPSPIERAPELAFVSALAVRDAIIAEAPTLAPRLGFKWPNDLLLAGEKCAGILIEGDNELSDNDVADNALPMALTAVIGIGVNCAHHPPAASSGRAVEADPMPPGRLREDTVLFPATDLRVHGADVTPPQLFARLSATMCRRLAQWDRGRGFSAILGDWIAAACGIGEMIVVRNGTSDKTGRFVGLDPSGRLVLEAAGGKIEKIAAGDVFPFALRGVRREPNQQAD